MRQRCKQFIEDKAGLELILVLPPSNIRFYFIKARRVCIVRFFSLGIVSVILQIVKKFILPPPPPLFLYALVGA